jgi:hypothetical protein
MELMLISQNVKNTLENLQISKFSSLEAPKTRIEKIIQGYTTPIRSLDQTVSKKMTAVLISDYAKHYCGAKEESTDIEVYQICAKIMVSEYSQIGIIEIEEAFLMAASNKFDGIDMIAYGGIFSVSMFGDIMYAYLNHRNKIVSKYLDLMKEKEREETKPKGEELDLLNKVAVIEFVQQVNNEIERVKSGLLSIWKEWERVPAVMAEKALKAKMIEIDDDFKQSIRRKAVEMSKSEVRQDARNIKSPNRGLAKQVLDANFETESQYFKNKVDVIYAKLLIFEFIQSHKQ